MAVAVGKLEPGCLHLRLLPSHSLHLQRVCAHLTTSVEGQAWWAPGFRDLKGACMAAPELQLAGSFAPSGSHMEK